MNPLDIDESGKATRERSRAVRRSVERTKMSTTGPDVVKAKSRRISKHDASKRREKAADAIDRVRDTHAGSPEIARNKLRSRQHAPAASGRKGGPGKRRPYPKKTRKR